MQKMALSLLIVLVAVMAMPAIASKLSVTQGNGRDSLSWHDGKDALVMWSNEREGIRVIEADPDGVFGLRKADDILAVDGKPVDSISGLLDKLRASKSATASLLVLRQGSRQAVTVAVKDYMRFMPPRPPAPPAPPAAPAPPASGG